MGMTVDFGQITLGNIIEIIVIGGGWIATIVKLDGRLKSVEKEIVNVVAIARWKERTDERIFYVRRDIDDLRRGRGWVQRDLDGEYTAEGRMQRHPVEHPDTDEER